MNEIKLTISDENIDIVLSILDNLKDGLIDNIQTNSKTKIRATKYQPKINKVIYEHDSCTNDSSGKYSVSAYRQRLKKK